MAVESESETLRGNTIHVAFRDFQFLQGYMARRILANNRQKYVPALLGVVLCAVFLTMTIVLNVGPYRTVTMFGTGLRYPLSFYLLVILFLVAAIASLIPAIKLRLRYLIPNPGSRDSGQRIPESAPFDSTWRTMEVRHAYPASC